MATWQPRMRPNMLAPRSQTMAKDMASQIGAKMLVSLSTHCKTCNHLSSFISCVPKCSVQCVKIVNNIVKRLSSLQSQTCQEMCKHCQDCVSKLSNMVPKWSIHCQTKYQCVNLIKTTAQIVKKPGRILGCQVAMGQNPNRTPSEHPNPTTKIGSKMGGEFHLPQTGIPIRF